MPKIQFGPVQEQVTTRQELSLATAKNILKKELIAIIGYGIQGSAQALNLRDNGFNIIIGQRPGSSSWNRALSEGWAEDKNLFPIETASEKATFICYLLSDAAQIIYWPKIKKHLTPGKTLCFAHGFSVVYSDKTKIIPSPSIDVVLVAPKGSGRTLRNLFIKGSGMSASCAVHQDRSGHAKNKALAFAMGIGSSYVFETTFKNEVYSDLVSERGVLVGALGAIIAAQYQVLRENGSSPSEAFNDSVEELTQSLVPLIGENGMDWMLSNCSSTAQRGALDWMPRFKKAVMPVFRDLYKSVASGKEAEIVIRANKKKKLQKGIRRRTGSNSQRRNVASG